MAIFNVGMLVSHLRQSKNMTQEQLAEGICARATIGRIEKGERRPDWFTFSSIMYRLGQDPEAYHSSYADKDELYVINEHFKMDEYAKGFNYKALKEKLDELEKNPIFYPPQ